MRWNIPLCHAAGSRHSGRHVRLGHLLQPRQPSIAPCGSPPICLALQSGDATADCFCFARHSIACSASVRSPEAADDVAALELGEEVQAQVHQAHDRVGLKDAPRPRHEPAAPDRPPEASAERLIAIRSFRFHSWRLRTGDIGFMTLRRLRPLPPNTGSEADPGPGSSRARESEELLAALRGSLRSPRVPRSMCG